MKMAIGECRQTRRGQPYCRFRYGVRFVPGGAMAGVGMPYVAGGEAMMFAPGLAGKRRGSPMRMGECRRTRKGRKYCKKKEGVRFVRG